MRCCGSARMRASFVTGVAVPIDGGQSAGHKPPQMYRQGEAMSPTAAG